MQNFTHHASYCLLQGEGRLWQIQHFKVAYDYEQACSCAERHKRKDWAYSLRTGRAV